MLMIVYHVAFSDLTSRHAAVLCRYVLAKDIKAPTELWAEEINGRKRHTKVDRAARLNAAFHVPGVMRTRSGPLVGSGNHCWG